MKSRLAGKLKAGVMALAMTVSLTGCTIPFINVEVPIDLPDLSGIKLPDINLEDLNIPKFTLPIGVRTSVEEARDTVLAGKVSSLDQSALVSPGYLTVGLKTASLGAPMCVEGNAGKVLGLDVDIAAALASEMGLRVRYVPVTDASSLGTKCDVIMSGQTDNPNNITIAGTYVESATSFFYRGSNVVSAATDFGGKSVGVQGGSVSEALLNNTGLKMSQKSYASLNEAFDALANGEVDYVLCEAYPGAYLASLHKGIGFAGSLEVPVTSGVAVLTENAALATQVQTAFDTISQNGILQVVRSRWVGEMPTLTTDSVIQNVPAAETGTSGNEESDGSETSGGDTGSQEEGDGSDAGSNAITNI